MCGLFGKIARNSTILEKGKLNALGVINDDRGGDSVGLFIDGDIEIGVKSEKFYSSFMHESQLLEKTENARIVLGHTRKASVGSINEENAQPVAIRNEEGQIEFVLIHNGTIFNYEFLAKEYIPFIDTKGMTDTKVLAHIIYYCGYDVLEKYEGAAALVVADYRNIEKEGNPEIFMFKGSSSKYRYSKVMEEERPLYLTINDDSLWFSSIGVMLSALNYPMKALTLKENILAKVMFGKDKLKVLKVKDINRDNKFQYKNQYEYNGEYRQYEGASSYSGSFKKTTTDNKSTTSSNDKSMEVKEKTNPTITTTSRTLWIDNNKDYNDFKVSLHLDGLYYCNNKLAHGAEILSTTGYKGVASTFNPNVERYLFFKGRLLPNEEIFKMLSDISEECAMGPDDFAYKFAECIDKYSYIPPITVVNYNPIEIEVFEQEDFGRSHLFDGSIRPMFSYNNFEFKVSNGIIVSKGVLSLNSRVREAFNQFQSIWNPENIDLVEEANDMRNYIVLMAK